MEKIELGPHFPQSYLFVGQLILKIPDYFFVCSYRDLSEA